MLCTSVAFSRDIILVTRGSFYHNQEQSSSIELEAAMCDWSMYYLTMLQSSQCVLNMSP